MQRSPDTLLANDIIHLKNNVVIFIAQHFRTGKEYFFVLMLETKKNLYGIQRVKEFVKLSIEELVHEERARGSKTQPETICPYLISFF